jgi:hypothetical protein
MSPDPVWAPVIPALGASFLIVLGTWGLNQFQHRQAKGAAERQEQHGAYQEVLNRSRTIATRARTLGDAMRFRSGLNESLSVLLRLRRVLDSLELYDWMDKDLRPLGDAWLRVWVVGTQQAIDAADRVVIACFDMISAATAHPDRSLIARAYRALAGEVWTQKQLANFDDARDRLDKEQAAFVKIIRKEMGKEAVELALERAERKARELPDKDRKVT